MSGAARAVWCSWEAEAVANGLQRLGPHELLRAFLLGQSAFLIPVARGGLELL